MGGRPSPELAAIRRRKLRPAKHKGPRESHTVLSQLDPTLAPSQAPSPAQQQQPANMSFLMKFMIGLSIITLMQPIRSLALSPDAVAVVESNTSTMNANIITTSATINNNISNPETSTSISSSPSPSDPMTAVTTTTMAAQQTKNGTYKMAVSEFFNDLSLLSDSVNATVGVTDVAPPSNFVDVTNNSQMDQVDDNSLIISVITANILIFVIGFCGNSLVILVILRFTRIETVTDIYILNLAFADLMFLFGLVFLIITMFIDHWVFGNLMCKLYMASTSLNQFASSLLLVVMSFDRFLAVCHPIYAQRFRRLRRAKIICFCIWIMCLILMTPIFAFAKTNKELTCAIFWPEYKSFNCEIAFTLYSFGIGFAIPLLLIAGFYTCVIRKLRIAASGQINLGSARRLRSRETTNKRIEHLVIGIITTYTICWLPYWMTQLCVSFTTTFEHSPIEGFYPFVLIATCLSYTNSALNPILYAFLSDNFKRRCSDVFRSLYPVKWCRRRRDTNHSHNQDPHSTMATALCEHSEILDHNNNNNNNHNNSIVHKYHHHKQRSESRHTVVMNESICRLVAASPSRIIETQRLTSTTDGLTGGGDSSSRDNHASNSIDRNNNKNASAQMGAAATRLQQYSLDCRSNQQQNHNNSNSIHIQHSQTNGGGSVSGSDDLGSGDKFYELDTMNNGGGGVSGGAVDGSHDNQAKRKSVAFSIGTIVVQGPNNNGQIVKGDHKILQVLDKKLQQQQQEQQQQQQRQEAV